MAKKAKKAAKAAPKKASKQRKRYGAYKLVAQKTTVDGAVQDAFSIFEDLRDQMQEMQGNMEGTSAEQTPKYEVVTNAADELEEHADYAPDVPDSVGALEITVYESVPRRKGRTTSRATQLGNAFAYLDAVITRLEEIDSEDAAYDDAQELATELENHKDFDVEFPTMYG